MGNKLNGECPNCNYTYPLGSDPSHFCKDHFPRAMTQSDGGMTELSDELLDEWILTMTGVANRSAITKPSPAQLLKLFYAGKRLNAILRAGDAGMPVVPERFCMGTDEMACVISGDWVRALDYDKLRAYALSLKADAGPQRSVINQCAMSLKNVIKYCNQPHQVIREAESLLALIANLPPAPK